MASARPIEGIRRPVVRSGAGIGEGDLHLGFDPHRDPALRFRSCQGGGEKPRFPPSRFPHDLDRVHLAPPGALDPILERSTIGLTTDEVRGKPAPVGSGKSLRPARAGGAERAGARGHFAGQRTVSWIERHQPIEEPNELA